MGFSGDLGDIGLNDVFQNISSNLLSGTLHITKDRRTLFIHFLKGKVSKAISVQESGQPESGHEINGTKSGKTGKKKKRSKKSIKTLLNREDEEGEAFRASIRESICEALYEAFSWTECRFEFKDGELQEDLFPVEQVAAGLTLETEPILMEAARRTDEWARIHRQIRSLDEVFIPVTAMNDEEVPEDETAVEILGQVDGQTDLETIISRMPQGRFAVCKAISDLLRDRWIRPLTLEERLQLTTRLEKEGNSAQAIRLLTSALEHERNEPTFHEHLGELHAKSGHAEKAAQSFSIAGSAYLTLNREEEALKAFTHAVSVSPTDVGARERLFNLLIEREESDQAMAMGHELAALYAKMGLLDRARDTYVRLKSLAPDDMDLLVELAQCERSLGNNREATKLFKTAANTALKKNEVDRAKNLLREILKIQPNHTESKRLFDQVENGEHALRTERRKRTRQFVVWGLGVMVVLYALTYEVLARTKLHNIQKNNTTLIAEGRFLEAIESYDSLRDSFPLSLARIESGILIEELARRQIIEIESKTEVSNRHTSIENLEKILTLAVAPDVYEQARNQITRLRIENKILSNVAALSNPDTHDKAKQAIESLDDTNALSILEKLLEHKSPEVRHLVLRPLITMKSYRTIPKIIELLKDPNTRVRTQALNALLILTRHSTPEIKYQYWIDWWRNEGSRYGERTKSSD